MLNTPINTIMTTEVIAVQPNDEMKNVKKIFDTKKIHHLPVIDEDDQLVGILSLHDFNKLLTTFSLFQKSKAEIADRRFMMSLLAKDVMSSPVAKLHPDDPVSTALGIFTENLFHALPIVDSNNRMVGILTTFDLLNFAFNKENFMAKPTTNPSSHES